MADKDRTPPAQMIRSKYSLYVPREKDDTRRSLRDRDRAIQASGNIERDGETTMPNRDQNTGRFTGVGLAGFKKRKGGKVVEE